MKVGLLQFQAEWCVAPLDQTDQDVPRSPVYVQRTECSMFMCSYIASALVTERKIWSFFSKLNAYLSKVSQGMVIYNTKLPL